MTAGIFLFMSFLNFFGWGPKFPWPWALPHNNKNTRVTSVLTWFAFCSILESITRALTSISNAASVCISTLNHWVTAFTIVLFWKQKQQKIWYDFLCKSCLLECNLNNVICFFVPLQLDNCLKYGKRAITFIKDLSIFRTTKFDGWVQYYPKCLYVV